MAFFATFDCQDTLAIGGFRQLRAVAAGIWGWPSHNSEALRVVSVQLPLELSTPHLMSSRIAKIDSITSLRAWVDRAADHTMCDFKYG